MEIKEQNKNQKWKKKISENVTQKKEETRGVGREESKKNHANVCKLSFGANININVKKIILVRFLAVASLKLVN